MVEFSDPPRRPAQENLLPMINVVFLLLIFFLISARMTPPDPFAITPPHAQAEAEALGDFALFVSADGQLGYRDTLGDGALVSLAVARSAHCATTDCVAIPPRLTLRADAALPAARLAQLLPLIAPLGFARIELVAQAMGGP